MNHRGSLSEFVKELIIKDKNTSEIWNKLIDALTTHQQNITMSLENPDNGNIETVTIPAFKHFEDTLKVLEKNVEKLAGMENESVIRTKDGSLRNVIIQTLLQEPKSLSTISTPKTFNVKNNWFFENFLNPLLYVTFDYSGKLDKNIKEVEVTKLLLQLNTPQKISWFSAYKGSSSVDYTKLIKELNTLNIEYIPDVDRVPLAVQENTYNGFFTVLNIYDDTKTIEVDGKQETILRKKYQLDTLNYNSKNSNLLLTETLKIGDSLVVNTKGKLRTRYKIIEIDRATNTVILELLEGYDPIKVGNQALKLYSPELLKTTIEVPIGFNNYTALFIRPIDSKSNIVADFYSPGTLFYSNDLTLNLGGEKEVRLEEYYRSEVTDFGQYLLGIAKDATAPSIFGEKPTAPVLDKDDFKVVVINKHQTNKSIVNKLKQLHNEKNTITSEITELTKVIEQLSDKINVRRYSSELDRNADEQKLQTAKINRANKKETYNSLVVNINNISSQENIKVKPKYRIRGFWDIPTPKFNDITGTQNIVQFVCEYRYLSADGEGNPNEQITYKSNNGNQKVGSFSEWNEFRTEIRKKEKNKITGHYEWVKETTENADVNNINQLDIPIRSGEKVEIRIKSVSEAGFPINPLMSDWSDSVIVDFPIDLVQDEIPEKIVKQSEAEIVSVKVDEELQALGIVNHLSDSYSRNGRKMVHRAKSIDSGFVNENQEPIDLFEKIRQQDELIAKLKESLAGNIEDYEIYLEDEDKNKFNINVGSDNPIFAGYYKEIVEKQTVPLGSIVTRIYKLVIKNNSKSDLVLDSLDKGSANETSNITTDKGIEYFYAKVPIGLQNSSIQHHQTKGQILYNRYTDIQKNHLYDGTTVLTMNANDVVSNADIASGRQLDTNKIYVHEDHPNVSGKKYNGTAIKLPKNLNINNIQNEYTGNTRISFEENDRYLIGPLTTGSFLYTVANTENNENLRVSGDTIFSKKVVKPGEEYKVPIYFQFRMTDYYGNTDNAGNTGFRLWGNIGGKKEFTNVSYTKKLGFDFYTKYGTQQGFDITFTAKYTSSGTILSSRKSNDIVDPIYTI